MNANTDPSNTAQNNPDITRSVTGTYTKVGRQVTVYAFWNNIHDWENTDLDFVFKKAEKDQIFRRCTVP